jgi:hypothetical protein
MTTNIKEGFIVLMTKWVNWGTGLVTRFSTAQWWSIAIVLLAVRQLTQLWLDGLYAQSLFPVPFYVGQTTFDATELKSYYAVLVLQGTLGRFFWVQMADFLFMVTVFTSFFAVMVAIYRSLPAITWLKKLAMMMIVVAPMAALFDAAENGVSFFFMADPAGFADWLVYPYSGFAVIKFAIFILAYLWIVIGSLVSLTGYGFNVIFSTFGRRV